MFTRWTSTTSLETDFHRPIPSDPLVVRTSNVVSLADDCDDLPHYVRLFALVTSLVPSSRPKNLEFICHCQANRYVPINPVGNSISQ